MPVATRVLGEATLDELGRSLAGEVVAPGHPEYEAARRVWNGSIDRRPAVIARCAGVADVIEAVRFARSEGLLTAVRGGAHNVAGHSTCDDGIVIDLAGMRRVEVDAGAMTARVEGGALWGDLDGAAQAAGLATTGGMISSTGVGGLTLGGGVGWLMRKHGLTCDNLVAADLVTADGATMRARDDENPDLFWALRGGGGNFGVVTSFEFRLHPVGQVLGGAILHPLERLGDLLRFHRDFAPAAPDELTTLLAVTTVPPAPDFPPELHGRRVAAVGFCHAGGPEEGERAIAPLRRFARPLLERVGVMPYAVRQRLQDASAPAGCGNYWKSEYLAGLDDGLIDLIAERAGQLTSPRSMLQLYHLGGAVARVPEDATAYSHRSAPFLFSIVSFWDDPAADASQHVEWTRAFWRELRPYAAGAYVNFMDEDEPGRIKDAYGDGKYRRLAAVKAAYDPTNFFRLNHNVEPAEPAGEGAR